MNSQKKVAVIQDISGYGRCSMTVALPILSALKVQCCPVPTSIFSNHTGYPHYFFDDYTQKMPEYISHWERLGLTFDGIYTGFLGSKEQIEIVTDFIHKFRGAETRVIIDPVMGDDGCAYPTYTPKMCSEMKRLITEADMITPNLTEACILTDTPYRDGKWKTKEILTMAERLAAKGPKQVVITGISQGDFIANYVYEENVGGRFLRTHRAGESRPGTGDVFASILAGDAVQGVPFSTSVKKASAFVKKCIIVSDEREVPKTDGVCFEEELYRLVK